MLLLAAAAAAGYVAWARNPIAASLANSSKQQTSIQMALKITPGHQT